MSVQPRLAAESVSNLIVLDSKLPDTIIWPVAGGKGGTGKSTLTANLGVGLSLLGYKVILVDGDLGEADLHLFFDQISPPCSLSSFLTKEVPSLNDVLLPTPNENLRIICGGSELVGMANLSHMAKKKLLKHISALDADYVLVDLGAGSAYNTLDFFTLSNDGIIVCTPEPHARVDAYGFIKNTVYHKLRRHLGKNEEVVASINLFSRQAGRKCGRVSELLDSVAAAEPVVAAECQQILDEYRPKLILNKVRTMRHIEEVHRFLTLVEEHLSTKLEYVGHVRDDGKILDACERRCPILLHSPKASASTDLYNVIMDGLQVPDRLHRFTSQQSRKISEVAKAEAKFW